MPRHICRHGRRTSHRKLYNCFHKHGWPDNRTEIKIQAGEARPVEYSFPHDEVTVTSVPRGAEILHGGVPLGFTPLTIDLLSGEQTLTTRLKNYLDRTQTSRLMK